MKNITNETFGKSKAIHSPTDMTIKNMLTSSYGSYIESTDENEKTPSVKRRVRWENCQNQIRNYLEPFIDLSEMRWAYPTNGIHESIDWMCTKVKKYQVFEGEYRYPTFMKKPVHVATSVNDLQVGVPLYMSNPFSATGNFDRRYDEVGSRQLCPIYLDLAFVGTTGQYRLNLYENVKEVFWSCSKPYGLGLLRAGVRFVREAELSTLDEHCAIIDELAVKPNWDWHKIAELVHENQFVMECRWTDGDEIVTSVDMKKDGKIWRGIVSRTPRKKAA